MAPEGPDVPRGTFLSVADVPRGTFFRQRPFEGGDKQREKTPLPMENSGWLSKTPMFHVEHFERGRCSTWNIFKLCRCSTWEHFPPKAPHSKAELAAPTARESLGSSERISGSRRPRCSTWNILSLADVPRGTFSPLICAN